MTPEELAALAAKEAADALAAAAAKEAEDTAKAKLEADAKAKTDKSSLSDNEAALLKDVMKHKAAAADAKSQLEAAQKALKDFDGLDAAQLRGLLADKAAAELKEAEKRGEYSRIIEQVKQDADARHAVQETEKTALSEKLKVAQAQIDDLTIGSSFRASKFISGETVLTGDKARRLYGDHFEIEDGDVVAYDKPRGASDRTPLVDTRTGAKLDFEAAITKIMKADADFEGIQKSKAKPGTNSGGNGSDKQADRDTKKPAVSGVDRIAAGLSNLTKSK